MARELLSARYAQALFALALERGIVDHVEADLTAFAALLESQEFSTLFFHPKVMKEDKKTLVDKVSAGFDAVTVDFLKLLVDKRRESAVRGIARKFSDAASLYRGEVRVEVRSTQKLNEGDMKSLASKFGGTNKRVVINSIIDPSILGGLMVRVGNVVYDGSVAGRLARLKRRLSQVQVRIAEVKEVAP